MPGLISTPFFHIECSGPSPTPFHPHCTTVAEGGWDQESVQSTARTGGWTQTGRSWYCPLHKQDPAPARKSRPESPQEAS